MWTPSISGGSMMLCIVACWSGRYSTAFHGCVVYCFSSRILLCCG